MENLPETLPHLVLNWTFDIPNYKLFIKIADDLEYEAHEGGTLGYTKTYQNVKTHVTPLEWEEKEKFWISRYYGHIYGYFQPDHERVKPHPKYGWFQQCVNGLGPDGEYLDHMQRMQVLLEGNDMAFVWGGDGKDFFLTPDRGLTIYKRALTTDVNYPEHLREKGNVWLEWPQACLMQPRTKGPRLSSYDELKENGAPADLISKCAAGEWDTAPHPELQKWYIYPTS